VTLLQKPKSRLEAHAPQCARCKALMKVRILIPGRKVDDVSYRCEKCGGEVMRSVPRAG
jgi:predicted SprT family Zn-dependent metalloprotease